MHSSTPPPQGGALKPLSYTRPCHVQQILQPYTRLDTENPYPVPDLLFLELYHY